MSAPTSWWQRNRRALFAVPVLLVLAMAANGQRAVQYWWPAEPREAAVVDVTGSTTLTPTIRDANGLHDVTMTVRVVDTTTTTQAEEYAGDEVQDLTVPANLRVWRITVHVTAPPEDILDLCQIRVLDSDGREYATGLDIVDGPGGLGYPCVPADDPGPRTAFAAGPTEPDSGLDDDSDPRPPEYDKYVYVVMPGDREPDRIRFWFELPRYAELPLLASAG